MRYLFCCNTLHGFFNFRLDVVKHLAEKGNDIIIVYPYFAGDENLVKRLPKKCIAIKCKMHPTGKNILYDVRFFVEVLKIIKAKKPNIVFNYTIKPNIYSGLASAISNIPSVAIVPGLGYSFSNNGLLCKLLKKIYIWSLRKASCVIALNNSDLQTLNKCGISNIFLFDGGEGVNLERFAFTNGDFSTPRFLMVSRLLYNKGYSEFVKVAKAIKELHPELRFEIAGTLNKTNPEGVPISTIQADEKMGAVKYLGYIEDIVSQISDPNTVVVLPSYYREGMNRSLMEACACGRPIITTNLPGLKETVENGVNGYVVNPQDECDLQRGILAFIRMPITERRKMGMESRRLAEKKFDVRIVMKNYDLIIQNILESNV